MLHIPANHSETGKVLGLMIRNMPQTFPLVEMVSPDQTDDRGVLFAVYTLQPMLGGL